MYTKTAGLPIRTVPSFKRARKTLTSIDQQKVYNYTCQLQLPTEKMIYNFQKFSKENSSLFKGTYFARNFRKEQFETQKRNITASKLHWKGIKKSRLYPDEGNSRIPLSTP